MIYSLNTCCAKDISDAHTQKDYAKKRLPILFFFVLDSFGVKYVVKEHYYHSISAIRELYPGSDD